MNLEAFARAISESDHTPHDGDCFPAAFHMAIRMVTRLPFAPSEIRVVHGWPILPSRPEVRHAHAWVEVGAVVIDGSNGNWEKPLVATTARVYPIGRLEPRHVVRYTMADVIHRTIDARALRCDTTIGRPKTSPSASRGRRPAPVHGWSRLPHTT